MYYAKRTGAAVYQRCDVSNPAEGGTVIKKKTFQLNI